MPLRCKILLGPSPGIWSIRKMTEKPLPFLSVPFPRPRGFSTPIIHMALTPHKKYDPPYSTQFFFRDFPHPLRAPLPSLEYPTMPPAGSLKVLRAPARWVGIRRAPKTKIYNLETGE